MCGFSCKFHIKEEKKYIERESSCKNKLRAKLDFICVKPWQRYFVVLLSHLHFCYSLQIKSSKLPQNSSFLFIWFLHLVSEPSYGVHKFRSISTSKVERKEFQQLVRPDEGFVQIARFVEPGGEWLHRSS